MDAAGNSYVFDGEPDIQHDQELSITQNPVQTGASISDHAFLVPVRVTAEILMSDAMQSFNYHTKRNRADSGQVKFPH